MLNAKPVADEQASYASAVLLNVGSKRLLVNSTSRHAFAVDAASGEVCCRVRQLDPGSTITTTPILTSGGIVFTNVSRTFGAVFSMGLDSRLDQRLWSSELSLSHGGAVCIGDSVFGASGRGSVKGWVRIDNATGAATAEVGRFSSSVIPARASLPRCRIRVRRRLIGRPSASTASRTDLLGVDRRRANRRSGLAASTVHVEALHRPARTIDAQTLAIDNAEHGVVCAHHTWEP